MDWASDHSRRNLLTTILNTPISPLLLGMFEG
jgi:hypothetical protein